MNRTPVESSNIKSIGYDQKTETLEVEYKGTGKPAIWQYFEVTPTEHATVLGTNLDAKDRRNHSVGQTFGKIIKGVKKSQRAPEDNKS